VACNRNVKKKDDEQSNEPTADFINCVAWRGSADYIGTYGAKGNIVCVDGHIQTRNYDKQDGTKVYVTEILAERLELIREKSDSNQYSSSNQTSVADAKEKHVQQSMKMPKTLDTKIEDFSSDIDINPDDLPF
jgi:single-strand DNA-binding protein